MFYNVLCKVVVGIGFSSYYFIEKRFVVVVG